MTGPSSEQLGVRPDQFGAAAPPKANGQLVFDEPWQSRAFGLTSALVETGAFSWQDFQVELVEQVPKFSDHEYWLAWLEALNILGKARGLVDPAAISAQRRLLVEKSLRGH